MLRLRVWHGVSCSVLMHLKDGWEEQRHNPVFLVSLMSRKPHQWLVQESGGNIKAITWTESPSGPYPGPSSNGSCWLEEGGQSCNDAFLYRVGGC